MSKHIETKRGLKELLRRYQEVNASAYWIQVIEGCIKEDLAMDEDDYMNTPNELRKLWRGLK